MKTSIALLFLWVSITLIHAHSSIIVEINSKGDEVSYTLNARPLSESDLEEWMKETILQFGASDPVTIRADETTSAFDLFNTLLLLKRSGVLLVDIPFFTQEDGKSLVYTRLSLQTEQIEVERVSKSGFEIAPTNE